MAGCFLASPFVPPTPATGSHSNRQLSAPALSLDPIKAWSYPAQSQWSRASTTSLQTSTLGSAACAAALLSAALKLQGQASQRRSPRICRHAHNQSGIVREATAGAALNTSAAELPSGVDGADTDNRLEEWLMGLDLPQPLRPILGSSAWANFTAAIAQMVVIGGLCALGTLLEQGGPAEFYARQYPTFSGIILTLGLDHVYSCPLFLSLLVWLAASIVACTGTTQVPLAKRAQRVNFRSSSRMERMSSTFLVRINCCPQLSSESSNSSASLSTQNAATERLQRLQAVLEKRGFAVRADDTSCPQQLAASRGLVGKFAPMMVHLALLLCLAGGAVGLIFGASSEVVLSNGAQADLGQVLDKGRRAKGPLYEILNPFKGLLDSTTVRVEDFRIAYRDGGSIDQFYSKLAIEDAKTKERILNDEIYVNKPLRYGGSTIYQAAWSIDRIQLYLNGVPFVVPLKQIPDQGRGGNDRTWGAFLPKELVSAQDPNSVKKIKNPNEGVVLVTENLRNVQVYTSDGTLAGVLRAPGYPVDPKMTGMPIQFGEAIKVDGSEIRLDRIVGATGLIVKSDPGVPLVYLGFAILMPATLLSVLPFGQVWAAVNYKDPNQLLVSGKANRNQPSFEDELKALLISGAV